MASYFHASPMAYTIIYVKHSLSISCRALDRYEENFTELQHNLLFFKNNLKKLIKSPCLFPYGYFRFAYCYTLIAEPQGKRLFLRYLVEDNGFSRRQLWVGYVPIEPLLAPISKLFI